MKVQIETYRGWDITFDTDKETFIAVSSDYDNQETKRSYASIKKYIDEFIKENVNFTPVKVMRMSDMFNPTDIITLIGIRKDKAFMYEDKKGNKAQLSAYFEKDYFLVNPDNEPFFKEIEEIDEQIKALEEKRKEVKAKVIKVGLDEIRNKYTL